MVDSMVNPHGRCYVFDSRGSGYARGEGVGTIVLKRLDDAIAAGDPVHAVIRNSGLNQDGKTAGISLPNPDAQAALMKWVYSSAGVDPRNTVYVEAHGTVSQFLQALNSSQIIRADETREHKQVSISQSMIYWWLMQNLNRR
jgi:acyl transferase domain-containing protein